MNSPARIDIRAEHASEPRPGVPQREQRDFTGECGICDPVHIFAALCLFRALHAGDRVRWTWVDSLGPFGHISSVPR